jgi:ribosomal protein L11 methyltransferase
MTPPGRRWLELRARAGTGDARHDLVADALLCLGGRAVEELGGAFVTHLPEPPELETFLLEARRTLKRLGLGDVELQVGWRADEDWAETWKRGLGPRRVGHRLVVTPSWCHVDAERDDIVVVLDPGMAFGNAEHGTTRGCLRLLERSVEPRTRVLDVGAGSGILSIAAARLGAREVLAVEGDALAMGALEENIERNGVGDRVAIHEGWMESELLAGMGSWDGVVANIESGVLRGLRSGLRTAVRPDGWLILSGILAEEWSTVRADFEAVGFSLSETDRDGDWVSAQLRARGIGLTPPS